MASKSEVGHDKNLANLDRVINLVTQFGATYNPSNPIIGLPGLNSIKTQATTVNGSFNARNLTYQTDTNSREILYEPLSKLITAIKSHLKTLDLPTQTFDDITQLTNKIQGTGSAKVTKADAGKTIATETNTNTEKTNSISTARLSYDSQLANFQKLLQILQTLPSYTPNENNIQLASLNALAATLATANLNAINATNAHYLARNQRNLIFYAPKTGLTDVMKKVKAYVKQLFGSQSPEYKQVSDIKFVTYVRKRK
jgi:hypothetical protein